MASHSAQLIQEFDSAGAWGDRPNAILVVEDNPFVRRATCELLTDTGYHVIEAESAAIARVRFAHGSPRVYAVLCDAVLPDASGMELCKMFKCEAQDVRVILTSGYPISKDVLEREWRCYFLEKPYSGESLLAIVESVFAQNFENPNSLLPRAIPDHAQNLPG